MSWQIRSDCSSIVIFDPKAEVGYSSAGRAAEWESKAVVSAILFFFSRPSWFAKVESRSSTTSEASWLEVWLPYQQQARLPIRILSLRISLRRSRNEQSINKCSQTIREAYYNDIHGFLCHEI